MKMVVFALVVAISGCGSVSGDEKHDARPADSRAIDSPPDTPPIAFSPSQLTGLRLWLDADKGVVASANSVSGWMDQSGQGNSAVQLDSARQPTAVAGVLNGHAVIRFDGTDDVLKVADAASLQFGTDDITLAVVASWSNPITSYGAILTKQIEGTYPYLGYSIWGNFPQPSSSTNFGFQIDADTDYMQSNATALNDGVARLFVGTRVSNTLEIRIGGTSDKMITTTTTQDASATGFNMYIGGHETTNNTVIQTLQGDIAELIAVRGPLTATELQKLEAYLKAKYAL